MTFRIDEEASDVRVIDEFADGLGWIAYPEERMQRASHALEHDGDCWVVDPVDADGLDDLLAEVGEVSGVVVTLDRHTRDADAIAARHSVPVYLPRFFEGVSEDLASPVVRFGDRLADTDIRVRTVVDSRFWREVCLYDPGGGTLLVPESLGTSSYFRAGDERLGVHPMRRLVPPRGPLGGLAPERILVGHGSGVMTGATTALRDALASSRTRAPLLYAQVGRSLLPV